METANIIQCSYVIHKQHTKNLFSHDFKFYPCNFIHINLKRPTFKAEVFCLVHDMIYFWTKKKTTLLWRDNSLILQDLRKFTHHNFFNLKFDMVAFLEQ
jgi:hypothetical protein